MSEALSTIAFASGVLGSVLGLVSLFYFLNDRIVRAKVVFKICYNAGGGIVGMRYPFDDPSERLTKALRSGVPLFPGIEVINVGRASFVVDEVGVTSARSMKGRGLLFPDLVLPDIKPPYRLGVGDSITLYATNQDIFALDR